MTAPTSQPAAETVSETRPIAIQVSNVSISFTTHSNREKRRGLSRRERIQVNAITDVSFTVYQGEAIGLVGRNGAGKSTLLRAIAGTSATTKGQILVSEPPQLLGVKAAMMNKLSGRSNIELGLLSLGFKGDELAELIEQVEEFTELGAALNRPMKTYSSGMRARLAFGVATAAKPGILLLDEALAVGDTYFKRRSFARLRKIRENAGAIMIASHSNGQIRRTCDRAVWLEQGKVVDIGPPPEILEKYEATFGKNGDGDGYQEDEDEL